MFASLTTLQIAGLIISVALLLVLAGLQVVIGREEERQLRFAAGYRRRYRPALSTIMLFVLVLTLSSIYAAWPSIEPLLPEPKPTATHTPTPTSVPTARPASTPASGFVAPTATARPTNVPTAVPYQTPAFAALVTLPDSYNELAPEAEPELDTALSELVFSADITTDYQPVAPADVFPSGSTTVYATFRHTNMIEGTTWSWVWGRDGEALAGGNDIWRYGRDGIGFVTLSPGYVLQDGPYALTLWINGGLYAQDEFYVGIPPVTPTVVPTMPPSSSVSTPAPAQTVTPDPNAPSVSNVAFSTSITSGYSPIDPQVTFSTGTTVVFGTFQHANMIDGAEWSWAWRLNGIPLDSGAETWTYGPDGFGFVRLDPGFSLQAGAYSLEIRHNGALLSTESFTVLDQ